MVSNDEFHTRVIARQKRSNATRVDAKELDTTVSLIQAIFHNFNNLEYRDAISDDALLPDTFDVSQILRDPDEVTGTKSSQVPIELEYIGGTIELHTMIGHWQSREQDAGLLADKVRIKGILLKILIIPERTTFNTVTKHSVVYPLPLVILALDLEQIQVVVDDMPRVGDAGSKCTSLRVA